MHRSVAYSVSRSGSGGGREQSAQFNSAHGGDAGDDMATMMMRGATQVRNVTAELGEQVGLLIDFSRIYAHIFNCWSPL